MDDLNWGCDHSMSNITWMQRLLLVSSSAKLASTKYGDVGLCLADYACSIHGKNQNTVIEHYEKLFREAGLHSLACFLIYNDSKVEQLCFSVIDFNR